MKIIRISLIALAAILLAGCGGSQQNQEETTQERVEQVETTIISRSTIQRVVEFSTTLMGYETVNIYSAIAHHTSLPAGSFAWQATSLPF